MENPHIHTIDLLYRNIPGTIACYLIPHRNGIVLIESGPGSTLSALRDGLSRYGYCYDDVTDIFLTHIHLDHAGAAGFLAKHGARIHVHPAGAPHMINPEKLLSSAKRLYGDMMETLWGSFLPVPKNQISTPDDEEIISIDELQIKALDTPGHANHHYVYIVGNICFSGDIGGVRLRERHHITPPMPPPELDIEKWINSINRIRSEQISYIAPTHFGLFNDVNWHLNALECALNEADMWMGTIMPGEPTIEELREKITEWEHQRLVDSGISKDHFAAQYAANPPKMSADGIYRYWHKYRSGI